MNQKTMLRNGKRFIIGASSYCAIELMWRQSTHWSMAAAGGTCFVIICKLSQKMPESRMWKKCLAGTGAITAVEFFSGMLLNKAFGLGVWDYSKLPLNLMGQICVPYCALWYLLCVPAFWLSDYIEHKESKNPELRYL